MIFHYGTDLPQKVPQTLDHQVPELTHREKDIIKEQIRKNSRLIAAYLERLDLLINKEKYPQDAVFIQKMRRQLDLLIEENDTFRKVLWKHYQTVELPAAAKQSSRK